MKGDIELQLNNTDIQVAAEFENRNPKNLRYFFMLLSVGMLTFHCNKIWVIWSYRTPNVGEILMKG